MLALTASWGLTIGWVSPPKNVTSTFQFQFSHRNLEVMIAVWWYFAQTWVNLKHTKRTLSIISYFSSIIRQSTKNLILTPPLPQTRKENDPQYYGTILFLLFFSPTITEIYFYVCDRVDHYEKTQGFSSVRNESGAKRNIFPIVLALLCRMKKRKRRDLPMNFGQKVQPFGWQKKGVSYVLHH